MLCGTQITEPGPTPTHTPANTPERSSSETVRSNVTSSDSTPRRLPIDIRRQPDDTTCGPTCLHAVFDYFGDHVSLDDVQGNVSALPEGGTLGVLLANHALARGYRATIVTWNLHVFDPTWFAPGAPSLRDRLLRRAEAKQADTKLASAASAYVEFLDLGGKVEFRDLEAGLLTRTLRQGVPILTGLSATFLYRESRQRPSDEEPDDVAGDPVGHFVVLSGHDPANDQIYVTDPLHPNPLSEHHTYPVPTQRLIGAIYLGVLTYDANLVLLEPDGERG